MKDLVVVDWRAWIGFGIDGWFDLGSNFVICVTLAMLGLFDCEMLSTSGFRSVLDLVEVVGRL